MFQRPRYDQLISSVLEQLSTEEEEKLLIRLRKVDSAWRRRHDLSLLAENNNLAKTFFDQLHLVIFRDYGCSDDIEAVENVINNIWQLKAQIAPIELVSQDVPSLLAMFILEHPNLEHSVAVTTHAWEQFCKRWFLVHQKSREPRQYDRDYFQKNFQWSFARARPHKLSPVHAARRMIKHRFQEASYLWDRPTNLRFVISGDKQVILTVEQAIIR